MNADPRAGRTISADKVPGVLHAAAGLAQDGNSDVGARSGDPLRHAADTRHLRVDAQSAEAGSGTWMRGPARAIVGSEESAPHSLRWDMAEDLLRSTLEDADDARHGSIVTNAICPMLVALPPPRNETPSRKLEVHEQLNPRNSPDGGGGKGDPNTEPIVPQSLF